MKKQIVLTVIALVVVIGIIVTVFFLIKTPNNKDFENELTSGDTTIDTVTHYADWFSLKTTDDLEQLAEKTNSKIEYGPENAYIADIEFAGDLVTFGYRYNSDKKITGLSIGKILVSSTEKDGSFAMDSITASELSSQINGLISWISQKFDVEIDKNFNIFAFSNDILSPDDENSYQKIITGDAYLELRILDVDDSVWVLKIEKVISYDIIAATFNHYMADSNEASIPCDVAIEK